MKIFNPNTINFTNTGLFPSNTLYPSTTLYPQAVDVNGLISNGDIVINPIECIEHREIGKWYIELEVSTDNIDYIIQDAICVVVTKEKGEQPFRIKNIEIGDSIICEAWHIGFDTKNYAIELSYVLNQDCQYAIETLLLNTVPSNSPFTAYSNINTLSVHSVENMSVYEALLSIADHYNGILDFDMWQIRIVSSIGADNGVTLAYGKNIQESEIYENWDLVVTKLKAIGNDGITLNPTWLTADISYDKPYAKIMKFDTDSVENLSLVANLYLAQYKVPRVNYKVKAFIEQGVSLGDTIHVNAEQFEIDASVLSYKFDINLQSFVEVEFGNYRRTVEGAFDTIKSEVTQTTLEVIDTKGYIRSLIDDEVVTVGEGGDYTNINDALFYLAYKYPRFKQTAYPYVVSSAEILLLSGFVMNEQVVVERTNLGFISISSEDTEVTINRSALTYPIVSGGISYYPAFVAKENATLPVINCLFNMNTTGADSNRVGVMCSENSSATVRSGCGVKMNSTVTNGCFASEGSSINADGSIFNGAGNAYFAKFNSRINANGITTSGNNYGALAEECSTININNSTITNSNAFGIQASRGSTINANSSIISNWNFSGAYSIYGSVINVTSSNCRKSGSDSANDIKVFGGSIIQANSSTGGLSQTANTITSAGIIFK